LEAATALRPRLPLEATSERLRKAAFTELIFGMLLTPSKYLLLVTSKTLDEDAGLE
jgi:hypothetical protein